MDDGADGAVVARRGRAKIDLKIGGSRGHIEVHATATGNAERDYPKGRSVQRREALDK